MPVSVHIADVSVPTAARLLARPPRPANVPGLREAGIGLASPLGPALLPRPSPHRVGLVAFWDDDASIDRFLAQSPAAAALADGFRARLRPLRAHGTWPGLDPDVPSGRAVDEDGPFIVLTLGRLKLRESLRFFRTSAAAEGGLRDAEGLVWATGFGLPPFVATCSLWPDTRSLTAYAYGRGSPAHANAIAEGERQAFHKQQAFIRFAPYDVAGSLEGTNPLAAEAVAGFTAA